MISCCFEIKVGSDLYLKIVFCYCLSQVSRIGKGVFQKTLSTCYFWIHSSPMSGECTAHYLKNIDMEQFSGKFPLLCFPSVFDELHACACKLKGRSPTCVLYELLCKSQCRTKGTAHSIKQRKE